MRIRIRLFIWWDPDPNPAPSLHHCDANLRPLVLQSIYVSILSLHASILRVHGHPWLHFDPTQLLNFDFDADFGSGFWMWCGFGFSLTKWCGSGSRSATPVDVSVRFCCTLYKNVPNTNLNFWDDNFDPDTWFWIWILHLCRFNNMSVHVVHQSTTGIHFYVSAEFHNYGTDLYNIHWTHVTTNSVNYVCRILFVLQLY